MRNLRLLPGVILLGLLPSLACTPPAPPPGDQLRLKGGKGALCLHDRECQSEKCESRQCTETVEKVGEGEDCPTPDHCEKGLVCDPAERKCSPVVRCDTFEPRVEKCIVDIYAVFRPDQQAQLQRYPERKRKRFLEKTAGDLNRALCTAIERTVPYSVAIKLREAAKETACPDFARALHLAIGNKS
jgi:hypothetical protein